MKNDGRSDGLDCWVSGGFFFFRFVGLFFVGRLVCWYLRASLQRVLNPFPVLPNWRVVVEMHRL